MKTTYYIHCLLWIPLASAMLSCGDPQPRATVLLAHAEQLMDSRPDSAMQLIDSIYYPEKSFNKKDYMRYWVARVQARYKNYRPVLEDTLIFEARDYFTSRTEDPEQSALACFYSGCVFREQGNFAQTMLYYKEAATFADKTDNSDLKALIQYNIGDLLAEQGLYGEALYNYRQAEKHYIQSPAKVEKQTHCLSAMGRMFILSDQQDSALVAFQKGLELAESIKDHKLQSILAQNLSIAYSEAKQYSKAATYLHKSLQLSRDSSDIPRYYLNFAKLYSKIGQPDSTDLYINKLAKVVESTADLSYKASAYNFLAQEAKKNGHYNSAFDYQQKRNDIVEKINEERLEQSVYEVYQKYDYQKQQNQYNHLLLRRQRISILLLSFFLLASLFSLLLLRQIIRQKNGLLNLQNIIQILNKTVKDLQKSTTAKKSEKQLKEVILWKLNLFHRSSLMKSEWQQTETMDTKKAIAKFDEIMYGKNNGLQWSVLEETIDTLYPGLSHFIRNTYPQFSDTEFKVCLLSYAGLASKKIALLINQSVHTVSMSRSHIRKKMNLQEPGADFCCMLKQVYEGNHSS